MLAVPDPKTVEFPVSCAQLTGKLFLQATGMILLSCAFRGGHPPDVNKLKWHLKSEKNGFHKFSSPILSDVEKLTEFSGEIIFKTCPSNWDIARKLAAVVMQAEKSTEMHQYLVVTLDAKWQFVQCTVTMCCECRVDRVKRTSTFTHCTRSWKVMENTPQKGLEIPGKPSEMFSTNPGLHWWKVISKTEWNFLDQHSMVHLAHLPHILTQPNTKLIERNTLPNL